MSDTSIFLDVNIPMYAAGSEHPYKAACVWVMNQIADGELNVVIDTEIVQEVLYRYGAMQRWEVAAAMATDLCELIRTIYAVDRSDVQRAIELYRRYAPRGIPACDVIHVAVMLNRGLTEILSVDSHFDSFEGITRLDPLAMRTW